MPDITLHASSRRRRKQNNADGIALAPGGIPLLGHAHRLIRDPFDWLGECRGAGPVLRVKLGPRTAYLVGDPDLVHQVLIGAEFDKGGALIDAARALVGNGLGTSMREEHRRQRPLMQPAFTQHRLDGYSTVIREEAARLAGSWTPHREVDLVGDLSSTTLRILIRVMLPAAGSQEITHLSERVRLLLDGAFLRAAVPFPALFRVPTPGNRRFDRALKETLDAADGIVAAARARPDTSGLLGALITPLTAQDETAPGAVPGDAFSDRDLRDQVMTLFVAGGDTTATLLAWLFHLLSSNPEAEEQVYQELDAVLDGAIASPEDFPRLPHTRNALQETLRLYPPAWMMTRIVLEDVELGGHRLPAGAEVIFSSHQLHHDPVPFPDPEAFDPGRWDRQDREDRHSYIPFHTGARKCIGDKFALAEATIILSAVAAAWRLRPAPNNRPRPRPPLSMNPGGIHLTAEPRPGRTGAPVR
jgi:pentalenene oxygenase